MSLADDARRRTKPYKGPDCDFAPVIEHYGWDEVVDALDAPGMEPWRLTDELNEAGFELSKWTVRRHLRWDCVRCRKRREAAG